MSVHDVTLFGDQVAASRLGQRFAAMDAGALLRLAIRDLYPGRIALVSSFGADSAVLLHMMAQIDKATPVIFVDTGHLFPETLAYRDELVGLLGLTDVRAVQPSEEDLATLDPEGFLWSSDPDACCDIRKVKPLFASLEGYAMWFTGLRREQAKSRGALKEVDDFKLPTGTVIRKISPLTEWNAKDVWTYSQQHNIPMLELYDRGYTSIGCEPCTSIPTDPNDPRSGRWGGQKQECGIHIQG